MDRKQIEQWAREAGIKTDLIAMGSASCVFSEGCHGVALADFERFAALVAAHEREQRDPVDSAIVQTVLPEAYSIIDELVKYAPDAPKPLVIRARKLLPDAYPESFAAVARSKVTPPT